MFLGSLVAGVEGWGGGEGCASSAVKDAAGGAKDAAGGTNGVKAKEKGQRATGQAPQKGAKPAGKPIPSQPTGKPIHLALPSRTEIMTPNDFLLRLGKKVEGINLLEVERYLKASRIARKISGYCLELEEVEGEEEIGVGKVDLEKGKMDKERKRELGE